MINSHTWLTAAAGRFPQLFGEDPATAEVPLVCEDLAYAVDDAHRTGDHEFLTECYGFIRWSMHHTEDERLVEWMADWFFDRILTLEHSKKGCLEFFDWGDVTTFRDNWTVEPSFQDEENFEALCMEWQLRWSRNEKLPVPMP